MTESYGIFDAANPEDPDREYSAAVLMSVMAKFVRDGYVHNDGDELAVSATTPAAMSVDVGTGAAIVQGRYYINDEALTLTVEAADPSNPRIDRVVVRLDATPGRTIHAVVKQGTPAASPTAPALTRTAETWELSLAQVRVEAGATSIVAAKITDERGNASLCGVAAPVYVPSSQLEVVGAVDMQGKALTGLPVPSGATDAARRNMGGATLQNLGAPSASTDAARKADVDSAISGLGISQVAIDADKNWNQKAISNIKGITFNDSAAPYPDGLLRAYLSDTIITNSATERSYAGNGTEIVKKIQAPVSGVYRVTCEFKVNNENHYGWADFLKNDVLMASFSGIGQSYALYSADFTVLAGDEICLRLRSTDPAWRVYGKNFAIRGACAIIPKATRAVPAGTILLD